LGEFVRYFIKTSFNSSTYRKQIFTHVILYQIQQCIIITYAAPTSRATVNRLNPMWIIASVFCLSVGLHNEIRKRSSSLMHGKPYGVRVDGFSVEDKRKIKLILANELLISNE
jgi:hypothetical protein